jgi:ethanolaminephosphotransferase
MSEAAVTSSLRSESSSLDRVTVDRLNLRRTTEAEPRVSVRPMEQPDRVNHGPFFFLSASAAQALPAFQYKGQDQSLIYKYILSPLAEWCVQNLTPKTMAPNTITMAGLLFMIAAYVAMWYYRPMLLLTADTDQDMDSIPRWVYLLNAVSILIYQTLDNMDGKQARRVGASSPLGLFFDHGCDAVNSVFGSANWMVALCLAPSDVTLCFAMLMGPYALFYFGTWEEYHTGELIMPIVNGPNEGLLGAVCMSIASYLYGPAFWHSYTVWNWTIGPFLQTVAGSSAIASPLRNADLLILASCVGFVQEITLKTMFVARNYGVRATLDVLPFLSLVGCSVVVGLVDVSIWLDMPRTSIHLCAFLFVEMTTELMLKHMTKQPFQPFRWILLPLVVFTILVANGAWPEQALSTADFLLLYSAAAGSFLVTKSVILIHEITHTLNIWCFDIVTPRAQRPSTLNGNGVQRKYE